MVNTFPSHKSQDRSDSDKPPESPRIPAESRIPVPLTPFVGREKEAAVAKSLLGDPATRLLTLTGPGGAGKSRLAIHVATELAASWAGRSSTSKSMPFRERATRRCEIEVK